MTNFLSPSRTRIKICGLTREADVEAAVHAGVDAIGLVLYPPSPRAVTAERAGQLVRRLPPFVTPVLLFVNPSPEDVQAACSQVPGATLQFHGDETPEFCLKLQHTLHLPFLKAARIPLGGEGKAFDLLKYATLHSAAQALLLDAHVEGFGGGGQAFDWSLLTQNVNAHLVLSGGLNAANVTEGIRQLRPKCLSLGVDVSSGVEAVGADGLVQKGLKDAEKIVQFVAAVRAADLHP